MKEPDLGELASRVLVVENMDRKRNIILWNIKGESKSKARDHVNTLLSHSGINIQFDILDFTDRFIKIQLQINIVSFKEIKNCVKIR